jgi:hypothetical protein
VYALAAAAAVLLAFSLWPWQANTGHVPTPMMPDLAKSPPKIPAEPLRGSVEQAGNAVVSLTSRTATETIQRTSIMLPNVPTSSIEPIRDMSTSIDPSLEPLREATQGVSTGLAPVADSARRAVGLFLRDLPVGKSTSTKKPG